MTRPIVALVPGVGNDPTYTDFQSVANPSQLSRRGIGVPSRDRTDALRIFSAALFQLSYRHITL